MSADAVELRVLGALLEKQRTTPDQYPLSLNALRLACNQSTNRDPVVDYDERTVHDALQRLARRGWTRLASGSGSRAVKHRQLFTEALGVSEPETAVLTVMLLRGPQTPGELKQRTERMHRFERLDDVVDVLHGLVGRELVERLERRPGQKEVRYRDLLGGDEAAADGADGRAGGAGFALPPSAGDDTAADPAWATAAERPGLADATLERRVEALEEEVSALRAELAKVLRTSSSELV